MTSRFTLRLAAPFLTISAVLLITSLATAWAVYRLQAAVTEVVEVNVPSLRAAPELELGLREIQKRFGDGSIAGGDQFHEELPGLREKTDHWLKEADDAGTTQREWADMAQVRTGYTHFFSVLEGTSQPAVKKQSQPELGQELDKVLTDEILEPLHDYLIFNEEQTKEGVARNRATVHWTVIVLVLLGVCGPSAGVFTGWVIARRINRSIVRLSIPVQDATGQLSEVVGPVTFSQGWDLDELEVVLKRLAEQVGAVIARLHQSQREALRAEQLAAVGQMAAGFAHELRNPLTSMKILVQSAAERGDRGALKGRDLTVLEEEILRLEHLTSSLMDFARPPQPEVRTFDLRSLIEDVVDLVAGKAAQRSIRIHCDLPDEPLLIEADAGHMRQVLFNLLLNAVEAVQERGSVGLAAAVLRGDGPPRVTIRVTDTGAGLPSELNSEIFAPFVSTKPTGLGLGLSVTRRIVEEHGGTITCANRPEGGAEFTVNLPCYREASLSVPL